jgi:tRNA (cmo5U34)-methyltransferase
MSIEQYSQERAKNYDKNSGVDKGNRTTHREYLKNLLVFIGRSKIPRRFVELGCGTGFFTPVFFEVFPQISGVAIDGSEEMLAEAKKKFQQENVSVEFRRELFEQLSWTKDLTDIDIVFSCLAIHHMKDNDKWKLFRDIYHSLQADGVFILFDLFKSRSYKVSELMEFLACLDIQSKLREELGIEDALDIEELRLENLITEDRRIKYAEGDDEAFLDEQLARLKEAGFMECVTVFQESRFVGIIAFKK